MLGGVYMDYNLIIQNFVNTSPFILEKDITSVSFKLKSNGEQVGIITTRYGTTYVKTITGCTTLAMTVLHGIYLLKLGLMLYVKYMEMDLLMSIHLHTWIASFFPPYI